MNRASVEEAIGDAVAAAAELEASRHVFVAVLDHSRRGGGVEESADLEALIEYLRTLAEVRKALNGFRVAAGALRARLPALGPADACRRCGGRRGPFRHGLDDRCRKRWERAGRPEIETWLDEMGHVPSETGRIAKVAS